MGFNVGLPMKKCAITPAARPENKASNKTGYLGAITAEFFDERLGKDKDINHDLTIDNIWLERKRQIIDTVDEKTGEIIKKEKMNSFVDYMKETNELIKKDNEIRKSHGLQKGRKDQVSAIAGIIKPPIEICGQKDFNYEKFFRDSIDILKELIEDDTRCGQIDAAVIHLDEPIDYFIDDDEKKQPILSPHCHYTIRPFVYEEDKETGEKFKTLNAKKFYNKFFMDKINRSYPALMRKKGWEVDDCKIVEDIKNNKEKTQQKEKAKGIDSVQYKAKMEREKERLIIENKRLNEENVKLGGINARLNIQNENLEFDKKYLQEQVETLEFKLKKREKEVEEIERRFEIIQDKIEETQEVVKEIENFETSTSANWLVNLINDIKSWINKYRKDYKKEPEAIELTLEEFNLLEKTLEPFLKLKEKVQDLVHELSGLDKLIKKADVIKEEKKEVKVSKSKQKKKSKPER